MFIVILILAILFFVIFLLNCHRKRWVIQKVSEMSYAQKCVLLDELAEPFGFSYQFAQDIFSSRADAWQREFGYGEYYDQAALSMNMVFDCEPVYFNYQGKTWLFEFWKGQYGINTGAEVAIFHADSIIPPILRPQTIFQAAAKSEMLPVKMRLVGQNCPFFTVSQTQWWLTGFVLGSYTPPEDLILEITITFPDDEMCSAFTRAMYALGYKNSELLIYQTMVQFYFTAPKAATLVPPDTLLKNYVLLKNHLFCELYLWITGPFFTTVDRLLCLYYTHPYLFKRTLALRMFKKHRRLKL